LAYWISSTPMALAQGPVLQSPGDDVLDRIENLIPGSAKCLGGLFPRKAARPTGQEGHVGLGQRALAVAPRTSSTMTARRGQLIVAARWLMAARADRGRTLEWQHGHLDALVVRAECGAMIDKSPKAMAPV
jgi:hypothetical protein